jgi:NAD+ kinase
MKEKEYTDKTKNFGVCFINETLLWFSSVRITTAQYPVPSVCAKDQMDDWFESLAECLHWNVRKPQKAMPGLRESPNTNSTSDSS